jgi:hypothetical protein
MNPLYKNYFGNDPIFKTNVPHTHQRLPAINIVYIPFNDLDDSLKMILNEK